MKLRLLISTIVLFYTINVIAKSEEYSWNLPYVCSDYEINGIKKRSCSEGAVIALSTKKSKGLMCQFGNHISENNNCRYFVITTTHQSKGENDYLCFRSRKCEKNDSIEVENKIVDNLNDVMLVEFRPKTTQTGYFALVIKDRGSYHFLAKGTIEHDKILPSSSTKYTYRSYTEKSILHGTLRDVIFVGDSAESIGPNSFLNPQARPFIPLRRDIKGKKITFKDTLKKMYVKRLLFSGKFNLPAYLTVGASGAPLMRHIGYFMHDIQGVGLSRSTVVESSMFSDRKVLDTLISKYLKKYPKNASSKKSVDKIKHAIGDVKWNLYQNGNYGQTIELSKKFKKILGGNNLSFGSNGKRRDEYRQSGDDYLDSGDDYLDSGDDYLDFDDSVKHNDKKKKSPIKKIKKEVIIKLSRKSGLFLDSKNILGFVVKKKWRKGKPINIYANNESIYMLQELAGKYNIKPVYAYSDISNDKVEPINLFNMRYPVKDSTPSKAEKICNKKMEICTTLKVDKKNQEIEIIIQGMEENRISKKIILDKYGYVKDKKQNYFSPWLMVKGDDENYLIDIKGLYFLDLNTVIYPPGKEKKYSRSKKMEIVGNKNKSRLLISRRKFGEKFGATPENFSFTKEY